MARTRMIGVRVTDEEFDVIVDKALKAEMTVSAYVRSLALGAEDPQPGPLQRIDKRLDEIMEAMNL